MSPVPRWHVFLPAIQLVLLGLIVWSAWPGALWRWALAGAIGAYALWAVAGLGASLTPMPAPNGRGLRTRGAYKWVRHPIYAALIAGSLLLVPGSWKGWLCWASLVAVLLAKVGLEERLLREEYPNFAEYAATTWRLIPFVW